MPQHAAAQEIFPRDRTSLPVTPPPRPGIVRSCQTFVVLTPLPPHQPPAPPHKAQPDHRLVRNRLAQGGSYCAARAVRVRDQQKRCCILDVSDDDSCLLFVGRKHPHLPPLLGGAPAVSGELGAKPFAMAVANVDKGYRGPRPPVLGAHPPPTGSGASFVGGPGTPTARSAERLLNAVPCLVPLNQGNGPRAGGGRGAPLHRGTGAYQARGWSGCGLRAGVRLGGGCSRSARSVWKAATMARSVVQRRLH